MADATDYSKAMQMNDISELLYHNESHVIDKMIDQATEILSEKAKPFKCTEIVSGQEIFVASQEDINAMVSNIPTPKSKHNKNLIPTVLLLMHTINGVITNRPIVALCDSFSSHSLMNKGSLPWGMNTFQTEPIKTTTTAGDHLCHEAVVMTDLSLLEFMNSQKITNLSAQFFVCKNCPYDVIFGRDFLKSIGLDIQFSTESVKWLDTIVDMKQISMYDHIKQDISDIRIQASNREAMFTWMQYHKDILFDEIEGILADILDELEFKTFALEITGRKYQAVSTEEVIAQHDQLTAEQKQMLKLVLDKHTVLFDGKVGCYTGDKVHLELIDNYTLFWKQAYPVSFTKEKVFKDKLDLMENEGTISWIFKPSWWAAPSFIITKQKGAVRVINDFRDLNKMLKRKPYELSRI